MQLSGHTSGLKASQIKHAERLFRRRCTPERIVTPELARELAELSHETGRQIGLLLDRQGHPKSVIIGDAHSLLLPEIPKPGLARLSGLRLVHTHLGPEPLTDDDFTDLALLRLDLIAALEVTEDGRPGRVHAAHLLPANESGQAWRMLPAKLPHELPEDFLELIHALEEEFARTHASGRTVDTSKRAILVHVSPMPRAAAEDSIAELKELARSAGIEVADAIIQRRDPDPKYVMGKGRMQQTLIRAMQLGAEIIVFDVNLSPSQVKALADYTDLKILDRTQVILDIFAQHATTREGKIQVELAQLRYLLPLLSIRQTALSRLTGGIGGRGPGETRLEVDRRRARDRIARLEREVADLGQRRDLRRNVRTTKGVPTVAVVGYTNAGKSTLLNQLTGSEVIAQDALFATLSPVSRRMRFPEDREIIITDTVGFIRNLPKDLMAAFRTTFEELHHADLLLHVMDAAAEDLEEKYDTVIKLLSELELDQKPMICVLNKIDKCAPETLEGLRARYKGVAICALERATFGPLIDRLQQQFWKGHAAPLPMEAHA